MCLNPFSFGLFISSELYRVGSDGESGSGNSVGPMYVISSSQS